METKKKHVRTHFVNFRTYPDTLKLIKQVAIEESQRSHRKIDDSELLRNLITCGWDRIYPDKPRINL